MSAEKSNPASVTTTISPSTTTRSAPSAAKASTSSGKYRAIGRPWRLKISTCAPLRAASARKPSHFGS
jgi:hypothetical protein